MHLTLFTDYALRSLLYLAWHPDRTCTVDDIAGYFGISADHVTKVMQHLSRKGYVRSKRGRHGGAVLARPPEDIRLGDVIRDFEHVALLDCLVAEGVCVIEATCRLKEVLAEGQRRMMAYFDEHTLRDLLVPVSRRKEADGRRTALPLDVLG
ncbi:MAG TPA: Rrf2 family transcriptional regulator [Gemmataceae bacterium]|nr:Rrf2 family transcriptional regulator [Gemmataceae bacterium]